MDRILKHIIGWLFFLKRRIILNRKISSIYKAIPSKRQLSADVLTSHRDLWKSLGSRPNLKWLYVYNTVIGSEDERFITESDFYNKVEPVLNNRAFSDAYADKNSYHRFLRKELLPSVYLRNIEGIYYNEAYQMVTMPEDINDLLPPEAGRLIAKAAVESGGGRGVELFERYDKFWKNGSGIPLTGGYLEAAFGKNFLLQEYIVQDQFYGRYNPSSVNTIRLLTYRSVSTGQIVPLQAVLRIGRPGSVVDNQASGGIACGINQEGILNSYGVSKKGDKAYSSGGIVFSDTGRLKKFDEIIAVGLEVAGKYYFQRLLGLDIAVDNTGNVKVIEINNRNNEINFFQMNNGPLFGEYTNEVIEFCRSRTRSFVLDFDL
jgi:hypothetical protein